MTRILVTANCPSLHAVTSALCQANLDVEVVPPEHCSGPPGPQRHSLSFAAVVQRVAAQEAALPDPVWYQQFAGKKRKPPRY